MPVITKTMTGFFLALVSEGLSRFANHTSSLDTWIRLVDHQLTVLNVFFYPLLSGSHPSASLQLYHFAGSCFAGYALLLLEGLRNGNRWTIIALYDIPFLGPSPPFLDDVQTHTIQFCHMGPPDAGFLLRCHRPFPTSTSPLNLAHDHLPHLGKQLSRSSFRHNQHSTIYVFGLRCSSHTDGTSFSYPCLVPHQAGFHRILASLSTVGQHPPTVLFPRDHESYGTV